MIIISAQSPNQLILYILLTHSSSSVIYQLSRDFISRRPELTPLHSVTVRNSELMITFQLKIISNFSAANFEAQYSLIISQCLCSERDWGNFFAKFSARFN